MFLMVKVTTPWHEYDERHPLNVYGQTKAQGEEFVEKLTKTLYNSYRMGFWREWK